MRLLPVNVLHKPRRGKGRFHCAQGAGDVPKVPPLDQFSVFQVNDAHDRRSEHFSGSGSAIQ
jgi:hypothetical protein